MKRTMKNACIFHSVLHSSNVVEIAGYSPFVNGVGALSVKENRVVKRVQYHVFKALAEAFEKCDEYVDCVAAMNSEQTKMVIFTKEKLLMDNKNILTKKHFLAIVEVNMK